MGTVQDSPGLRAAQMLLVQHAGSIYATFDSLDIGFDHDDVMAYVGPEITGAAFGDLLAFATICVAQVLDRINAEVSRQTDELEKENERGMFGVTVLPANDAGADR